MTNEKRIGNFTSSEIFALMSQGKIKGSFGRPALTYIEEKNFERRLGRSIDTESNARPLSWGKLVESRVFDLLGIEYKLVSQETIRHERIDYWSGSPDAEKFDNGKTVVDIKCPITLKSFCRLVEPLYSTTNGIFTGNELIDQIRAEHKDGEKYYWQLVSNAILTDSKFAELIVYCPYKSELDAIREMIQKGGGDMQSKYGWINWSDDSQLPYLPDGGFYKNLNVIRFEVPPSDKVLLHDRVTEAGRYLIRRNEPALV